jgi:nitroimidazol reductase NimA-like FMN-containing flavoprotein (pyridoxamine 5'-phosphate oxidase superfamily)
MTSTRGPAADAPAPMALVEQAPTRRPLTRAVCLALLAPGGHGRVAATMRAVPIIIPVSFTLVGEDIVFRPGMGEGLSRAVADSVVAFEADHVGSDGRATWGVHVTGMARTFTRASHAPDFRLSTEIVTGWREGG